MNEIMSLEQLEALAKNPVYTLSPSQIARLDELRADKHRNERKHNTSVNKHQTKVIKHGTVLEEPQDGVN